MRNITLILIPHLSMHLHSALNVKLDIKLNLLDPIVKDTASQFSGDLTRVNYSQGSLCSIKRSHPRGLIIKFGFLIQCLV